MIPTHLSEWQSRNRAHHRRVLLVKLSDILRRSGISHERDSDNAARKARNSAIRTLRRKAHISINVGNDARFEELIVHGRFPPSPAQSGIEAKYRLNAERSISDDACGSLTYGAFNWQSPIGGAPGFTPSRWLEIPIRSVKNSVTFTRRDMYSVTLPYFSEFNLSAAQMRLQNEVLCTNGVYEACLERFWLFQNTGWNDYIEVQIWRSITLNDVFAIHLHEDTLRDAEAYFAATRNGSEAWSRALPLVRTFR